MMRRIKNLLEPKTLLIVACCYMIIVTMALLSPTSEIPRVSIKNVDKIIHFGIHFVMVLLWLSYSYLRNSKEFSNGLIVKTLIVIFIYGIVIEFLQTYLTAARTGDLYDVIANSAGLLAGLITFRTFQKKFL